MKFTLRLASTIIVGATAFTPSFQKGPYQIKKSSKTRFSASLSDSTSTSDVDDDNTDSNGLFTVNIALTREANKNDKLRKAINDHPTKKMLASALNVNLVEFPCIEHATGPDLESFEQLVQCDGSDSNLQDDQSSNSKGLSKYDYIVITSPESAKVFADVVKKCADSDADAIQKINSKKVQIAAVGKATKKALVDNGINVDFVPSKADGETLAKELPPVDKVKLNRILYPASLKAANTIQETLESRKDASFTVSRFNTYDTVAVKFTDDEMDVIMDDVQVACFGSPSSVDSWLDNVDRILGIEDLSDEDKKKNPHSNGNAVAVCIGNTTAKRCLERGRWNAMNIYYPKNDPGIQGWADSCFQAAGDIIENSFWS